ncbi:MAG: hypothetical protein ACK57R_17330 [Dolichospermum sp.]|jgi:hypothetical protein|nr:hypothetical protein [Anabaena sp. 49628_E55]
MSPKIEDSSEEVAIEVQSDELPFADDDDGEVLLTAEQAESIIEEINHFASVLVQTANQLRNCIKLLEVGRGYEALGYKDMTALFKSGLLEKSRSTLQKEWQAHRVEQALRMDTGTLVLDHGLKLFPVLKEKPEKLKEVYHAAIEKAESTDSDLNARCIRYAIAQVAPEVNQKPNKQKPKNKSKVVQDGGSRQVDVVHNNPVAQQLENESKVFSGWSNAPTTNTIDADLAWIKTIANVGNSSDGNEFERLVRKSLIKLGFSCSNTNPQANLDPDKLGGPGGVDFYCEYPYQVVGECKATKTEKVPSKTPGQLIQLGKNHLQEKYDNCLKLIVAAGELTNDALLTTVNNGIYMIRPETLQKLVEVQTKYQNSVNLIELKECLQQSKYGLVDDKINEYIDKIEKEIKLRSHIIQIVKKHLEKTNAKDAKVDDFRIAYLYNNPPQNLEDKELYDILIELSSPLTGYLGRIKEDFWKKDRFYYLRDLPIN